METLVCFIKQEVDRRCYLDIPLSLLADASEDYSEFDKVLAREIGSPIKTVKTFLHELKAKSEPRKAAIRALMGGLTPHPINHTGALSCTYIAAKVYSEARRTMDAVLIKQWINGGGKGTKRSMKDNIQVSKVSRRKHLASYETL